MYFPLDKSHTHLYDDPVILLHHDDEKKDNGIISIYIILIFPPKVEMTLGRFCPTSPVGMDDID